MEAKLVVVNGKGKAEQFDLKLPAILGRSRSADVPLNHPLVSRQHCELFESDGQLMVRDLGSLNGTFVDENRVTDEVVIEPGGHLTVGSVTFKAIYEAPESTGEDGPPDFEVDGEEEADLDQTIDISSGKRAPAEKPAPAASDNEGFDMGWLDEGSDEEGEQDSAETEDAPAARDTAQQSDLSDPLEFGDEEDEEEEVVEKKPAAASRRGPPAKPDASRGKAPPPKKPASKSAAAADEETIQFAPAEGHKPEGAEGDDGMDDFFRSLSEP